jgi:hypothetical protein
MILPCYAYLEKDGAVTIYKDELGKNVFCRFNKHHSNKPTKRNKKIVLNCWTWQLNWITFRFTTFEEWMQKRLIGF